MVCLLILSLFSCCTAISIGVSSFSLLCVSRCFILGFVRARAHFHLCIKSIEDWERLFFLLHSLAPNVFKVEALPIEKWNCKSISFKNGVYCTITTDSIPAPNGNHNNKLWEMSAQAMQTDRSPLTIYSSARIIFSVHSFIKTQCNDNLLPFVLCFLPMSNLNVAWNGNIVGCASINK